MPDRLHFGTIYHIYNRGVNRCNLFNQKANYLYFLKLFTKHVAPITDVYAYCLLPNHFHFLLRIKEVSEILADWPGVHVKEPKQYFSNMFNAYARSFNNRYGRTGSLFQRPFGRIPVTSDAYFLTLITYIHRNPQKHGLVDDFRDWPYSSYDAILHDKPTRLDKTAVLEWFDGRDNYIDMHRTDPDETQIETLIGGDQT